MQRERERLIRTGCIDNTAKFLAKKLVLLQVCCRIDFRRCTLLIEVSYRLTKSKIGQRAFNFPFKKKNPAGSPDNKTIHVTPSTAL